MFSSRKKAVYGITTFTALSLTLLSFQNCSSDVAFKDLPSTAVIPLCRDTTAEEVKPKLKWDWYAKLNKSVAENYPDFSQVMATPMVADLNGDKKAEVVFVSWSTSGPHFDTSGASAYSRDGVIRIVNGQTGATIKSVYSADLAPFASTSPLLIDLNGDGKIEIVYGHYSGTKIIALNHDGTKRWEYSGSGGRIQTSLSTIDIDKDGRSDVILANEVVGENASGQPVRKTVFDSNPHNFAYRLNPQSSDVSIVGKTGVFNSSGTKLFSLDNSLLYAVGDVFPNENGIEIVGTGSGALKVFNGINGNLLSSVDLTPINDLLCPKGNIGGGPPTVGDFDGNPNTVEVAVATGRYLIVLDQNLNLMSKYETQDCSSLSTGISSFDFNGDKKPEILYADEEYLRIFEMRNGQLEVVHTIVNPSGTLLEYPVVADIDGNGSSELLVASNNYAASGFYKDTGEENSRAEALNITGVRAFESNVPDSWMPTRPIWSQYNFNPAMITDTGMALSIFPIGSTFLDKTFRRNAQMGVIEQTCIEQ